MAATPERPGAGTAPISSLRHACRLVLLIVGITMVVLVIVGSFGLIGPKELAIIIGATTVAVVAVDTRRARSGRARVRRDRR